MGYNIDGQTRKMMGYPKVWFSEVPLLVNSFLDNYNKGRTIRRQPGGMGMGLIYISFIFIICLLFRMT